MLAAAPLDSPSLSSSAGGACSQAFQPAALSYLLIRRSLSSRPPSRPPARPAAACPSARTPCRRDKSQDGAYV